MGNTNKRPQSTNQYVHPRLGNITRVEENNLDPYLTYEIVLQSQKLYESWIKLIERIKEIDQDIIFLPQKYRFEQTNFCGTGGVAVLNYPDYLYSLEPEIVNRREIKRPFNQQELLYLFYSLVKVQALFESKGKTVGDIKPENILVNEDGYVKVLSHYSYPSEPNRIVGWSQGQQRSFPAPQQCQSRHKRKDPAFQTLNKNWCQVFSIGLTILEAGSLKDCSQIYGFSSQHRFSQQKLRHFIDIFQNRYSQQFSYFIRQMLNPIPKKRINIQHVYERLKPYEEYILNLQEIQITIPGYESIPKVERQEKISIRKLGESQSSSPFQQSDRVNNSLKQSTSRNNGNGYAKISLGSSIKNPPYLSNIPNQQENPFAKSLQSGVYHPGRGSNPYSVNLPPPQHQQVNHQLVYQNSNYQRQPSQSNPTNSAAYQFYQPSDKPSMRQSMPGRVIQGQNSPQYLTQHSMVENNGRPSEPFSSY